MFNFLNKIRYNKSEFYGKWSLDEYLYIKKYASDHKLAINCNNNGDLKVSYNYSKHDNHQKYLNSKIIDYLILVKGPNDMIVAKHIYFKYGSDFRYDYNLERQRNYRIELGSYMWDYGSHLRRILSGEFRLELEKTSIRDMLQILYDDNSYSNDQIEYTINDFVYEPFLIINFKSSYNYDIDEMGRIAKHINENFDILGIKYKLLIPKASPIRFILRKTN